MKIAVFTGASSGMGKEFVLQLTPKIEVDEIWLIARREKNLQEVAALVDVPCRIFALDLTDPASFVTYENALKEASPNVTYLINCSGYGKFGAVEEIPLAESLGMIDLNCKALVAMTELTLPYMQRGAKIAQLDSLSSFQPVPYITTYGASKAFVLSYSRALNAELKKRGIHVMAICPGWVKTDFFQRAESKSEKTITYFNVLYEAKDVIKTAVKDLLKGKKDVSVHGAQIRFQVFLVKILPHSLVMRIWLKQQKKL